MINRTVELRYYNDILNIFIGSPTKMSVISKYSNKKIEYIFDKMIQFLNVNGFSVGFKLMTLGNILTQNINNNEAIAYQSTEIINKFVKIFLTSIKTKVTLSLW